MAPFEKDGLPQLIKGFSDQSKVADTHFLVSVVESTPFGEHFGLLVLVLGPGGGALG